MRHQFHYFVIQFLSLHFSPRPGYHPQLYIAGVPSRGILGRSALYSWARTWRLAEHSKNCSNELYIWARSLQLPTTKSAHANINRVPPPRLPIYFNCDPILPNMIIAVQSLLIICLFRHSIINIITIVHDNYSSYLYINIINIIILRVLNFIILLYNSYHCSCLQPNLHMRI